MTTLNIYTTITLQNITITEVIDTTTNKTINTKNIDKITLLNKIKSGEYKLTTLSLLKDALNSENCNTKQPPLIKKIW